MNPEVASYPVNYRFFHSMEEYSLANHFSQFKEITKLQGNINKFVTKSTVKRLKNKLNEEI